MSKPLQILSRSAPPAVLSLFVQAGMPQIDHKRGPFEMLVRHLLDRLLNSESLGAGEESAARVLQIVYALALPGAVVALFLFPLYHPMVGGPRPYWSQASDHFFYMVYAFVVMGLITLFLWDVLFPDQLDVFILTSLPIPAKRLLLARAVALAIFLGTALIVTNGLGALFFPSAAELPKMGLRHIAAHSISAGLCALFIMASLIALQGLFICILGQRITRRVAPVVQAVSVVVLLAVLFLFPLLSHFLKALLQSNSPAVRWFPPFWFLGIYERILWRGSSPPIFVGLAHTGLRFTVLSVAIALLTYPLAYTRRVKQIIEGTGMHSGRDWGGRLNAPLHAILLRTPRIRAIYHLIGQTVWRTQKIRLLLAIFGGLGLAMTTAELVLARVGHGPIAIEISQLGVRYAVPIMAFWAVAGLRAALLSPVGLPASWTFRLIHGRAKLDHLRATRQWVVVSASIVTLATVLILHAIAPPSAEGTKFILEQTFMALALPLLLSDIFFLRTKAIPFTEAKPYSVDDLSYGVVTYFVFYPFFVMKVVAAEPWIEASPLHLLSAALAVVAAHILLKRLHTHLANADAQRLDMEEDVLIPGEMGLRN